MSVGESARGGLLLQFRRRGLLAAGVAALLGVALAAYLDPTSTIEGAICLGVSASVLASLIVAAVALERNEFAQRVTAVGVREIFEDRLRDLPTAMWANLLRDSRRHFRVVGMANHGYLSSDVAKRDTEAALRKALSRRKVTVEFLWLDPEQDVAQVREREEGGRGLRRDTCESVMFFHELRGRLKPADASRLSLRLYDCVPTCGITWSDTRLIVTHYLTGELNLRAPGLVLDASPPFGSGWFEKVGLPDATPPPLAATYMGNYLEIAGSSRSVDIDDGRVALLLALKTRLEAEHPEQQSEAEIRLEPDPPTAGSENPLE